MVMDLEHVPVVEEVGGYMMVKAVSRDLGMKDQAVYYLLRSGQLKAIKLEGSGRGGVWLVSKASLERYKARRAARAAETATE